MKSFSGIFFDNPFRLKKLFTRGKLVLDMVFVSGQKIIEKTPAGHFELTEFGEYKAYGRAFEKLLAALLKRFKSIPEDQKKLRYRSALKYIKDDITSIDDYLDKIPGIAKSLGVKNEILQQFIGSHLNSLLEKIKAEIQMDELERIRVLSDPNRTASDELLLEIGGPIVKEGIVVFNPDGTFIIPEKIEPADSDISGAPAGDEQIETPSGKNETAPGLDDIAGPSAKENRQDELVSTETLHKTVPSSLLMKDLGHLFPSPAEPIIIDSGPPEEKKEPADVSDTIDMLQNQPVPTLVDDDQVSTGPSVQFEPPPSDELIQEIGQIYSGNESLMEIILQMNQETIDSFAEQEEGDDETEDEDEPITPELIEQEIEQTQKSDLINFYSYYKLISKLSAFQRQQDKSTYQNWLKRDAQPLDKTIVAIRNNMAKEKKGNLVDWASIEKSLEEKFGILTSEVAGIRAQMADYDKARAMLLRLQKRVIDHCMKSKIDARPYFKKIIDDLIHLFEKKDNLDRKKRSLKTTLFQINHSGVKNLIEKAATQELEILVKLYGL
jgi:hypothetical protein